MDAGGLGQMAAQPAGVSQGGASQGSYGESGFEDEPPLLQELGIDFDLIKQKVCVYTQTCTVSHTHTHS